MLVDKIIDLPDRIKAAIASFVQFEKQKQPNLNDLVESGAYVAAMMGSRGYQVVQEERAKQEAMLLSRFIGSDVTSYEKFLELRGFANGLLAGGQIESQIVAAGIKAEKAIMEARS